MMEGKANKRNWK